MTTITEIERVLKDVVSAIQSANRMLSDRWRIVGFRQAAADLRELAKSLEESAKEIEEHGRS